MNRTTTPCMKMPAVHIERHLEGGVTGFKAFTAPHSKGSSSLFNNKLFETTKLARQACQREGFTVFRYPDGKFELSNQDKLTAAALEKIVSYGIESESRHYAESGCPSDHIFIQYRFLQRKLPAIVRDGLDVHFDVVRDALQQVSAYMEDEERKSFEEWFFNEYGLEQAEDFDYEDRIMVIECDPGKHTYQSLCQIGRYLNDNDLNTQVDSVKLGAMV